MLFKWLDKILLQCWDRYFLSTTHPSLFTIFIFENCSLIPPSLFSSFNFLFPQPHFGVSPSSYSAPDSHLVPIYLSATAAGIVVSSWDLIREERLPVSQAIPLLIQPRIGIAPPETTRQSPSGSPSNRKHFCRAAAHKRVLVFHLHSWPLACWRGLTTACPCWTSPRAPNRTCTLGRTSWIWIPLPKPPPAFLPSSLRSAILISLLSIHISSLL